MSDLPSSFNFNAHIIINKKKLKHIDGTVISITSHYAGEIVRIQNITEYIFEHSIKHIWIYIYIPCQFVRFNTAMIRPYSNFFIRFKCVPLLWPRFYSCFRNASSSFAPFQLIMLLLCIESANRFKIPFIFVSLSTMCVCLCLCYWVENSTATAYASNALWISNVRKKVQEKQE